MTTVAWDGSSILPATYCLPNGDVVIWDPGVGERLYELPGHVGRSSGLDWADDGRRLVTAGDDELIRTWMIDSAGLVDLADSRVTRELTSSECILEVPRSDGGSAFVRPGGPCRPR
jgi:WD40 repeat protein